MFLVTTLVWLWL